jgi:hypothetical protein
MERVQAMMQFSTWLDSQGLHQQGTEGNYVAFQRATGYSPAMSPLSWFPPEQALQRVLAGRWSALT